MRTSGASPSSAWSYFSRSPRSAGTCSDGGGAKAALPGRVPPTQFWLRRISPGCLSAPRTPRMRCRCVVTAGPLVYLTNACDIVRMLAGHSMLDVTQRYVHADAAGFGNASFSNGSGRRDLNPRRRAPKARALPDCATPRGDSSPCLAWQRLGAESGARAVYRTLGSERSIFFRRRTKSGSGVALRFIFASLRGGGLVSAQTPMQNFTPKEGVTGYHLALDMAPGSPRRYAGPRGG
jgi:hypothetical protein